MAQFTLYWIFAAIIVVLLILIILSVIASRRRREAEAAETRLERRGVTADTAGEQAAAPAAPTRLSRLDEVAAEEDARHIEDLVGDGEVVVFFLVFTFALTLFFLVLGIRPVFIACDLKERLVACRLLFSFAAFLLFHSSTHDLLGHLLLAVLQRI